MPDKTAQEVKETDFPTYVKEVADAIKSMTPEERTERRERYIEGDDDAIRNIR